MLVNVGALAAKLEMWFYSAQYLLDLTIRTKLV